MRQQEYKLIAMQTVICMIEAIKTLSAVKNFTPKRTISKLYDTAYRIRSIIFMNGWKG